MTGTLAGFGNASIRERQMMYWLEHNTRN
ncbi:uncharacterized protein METZ01_LOCUS424245 [marine metagenome]|uniref:Uncharacterized protein n=1 Tax=marine metagenome TaxID=408172 RepID=A0A382XLR5_9ZZZZ